MKISQKQIYVYLVFLSIFITGLFIYPDFGFNIDEEFHRNNGFYWLKFLSSFFKIDVLYELSNLKLLNSSSFTQAPVEGHNKYGIMFDVPAALSEIFLKLEEPIKYYQMRHLMVFVYFFLGLIFFYKLLFNRFKNIYISLLGVILFFLTPRIFGDSFQNTKDIVFITFLIMSVYYYFKSQDNFNYKNIILFALFSSFATSTRIFGILLPLSFVFFYFLEILCNKKDIIKYKKVIFCLIIYFLFLYIQLPVFWENTLQKVNEFFFWIEVHGTEVVYFNGDYHITTDLPFSYLFSYFSVA